MPKYAFHKLIETKPDGLKRTTTIYVPFTIDWFIDATKKFGKVTVLSPKGLPEEIILKERGVELVLVTEINASK